jgi:hypothetical protein
MLPLRIALNIQEFRSTKQFNELIPVYLHSENRKCCGIWACIRVLKLCHIANKAHEIATDIYRKERIFVVLPLVLAEKKEAVKSIYEYKRYKQGMLCMKCRKLDKK